MKLLWIITINNKQEKQIKGLLMKGFIKLSQIILLISLQMGISLSSHADLYEPIPQCYQPTKPLWFATSYYKQRYEQDIDDYKNCMTTFIKKQKRAAAKHTEAAKMALKSWNEFVKEQ
ncbi:MAG: hypothetical protein DRQ43_08755 [Gammaproteobacteria bacterium]|nr:MAG: hypothetical protein DRQ43_08755 [Gammaproteobacteria bacterium]